MELLSIWNVMGVVRPFLFVPDGGGQLSGVLAPGLNAVQVPGPGTLEWGGTLEVATFTGGLVSSNFVGVGPGEWVEFELWNYTGDEANFTFNVGGTNWGPSMPLQANDWSGYWYGLDGTVVTVTGVNINETFTLEDNAGMGWIQPHAAYEAYAGSVVLVNEWDGYYGSYPPPGGSWNFSTQQVVAGEVYGTPGLALVVPSGGTAHLHWDAGFFRASGGLVDSQVDAFSAGVLLGCVVFGLLLSIDMLKRLFGYSMPELDEKG